MRLNFLFLKASTETLKTVAKSLSVANGNFLKRYLTISSGINKLAAKALASCSCGYTFSLCWFDDKAYRKTHCLHAPIINDPIHAQW